MLWQLLALCAALLHAAAAAYVNTAVRRAVDASGPVLHVVYHIQYRHTEAETGTGAGADRGAYLFVLPPDFAARLAFLSASASAAGQLVPVRVGPPTM
jgi:hypothetical protein